ncbi:hypothetical protein GGS20DRAFT_230635 [Poronia punctata]|nr:hypothetical protein GGS20DRAFT_230635 [Poronia punctata]
MVVFSKEAAYTMPPAYTMSSSSKGAVGRGFKREFPSLTSRKHLRSDSKSQPCDPEDLHRRLCAVLAKQEAAEATRRRQREWAENIRTKMAKIDNQEVLRRPEEMMDGSDSAPSHVEYATAEASPRHRRSTSYRRPLSWATSEKTKTSKHHVQQDKSRQRHKPSKTVASEANASVEAAAKAATEVGHPYVPAQAATQFSRTTTSERMRERSLVHSLSKAALRFTTSDREAIQSSLTKGKQQNILRPARPARGQRDSQQSRNQFQNEGTTTSTRWRRRGQRNSRNRPEAVIEEEESALAAIHLRLHRCDSYHPDCQDSSSDTNTTTTTLFDPTRRIDWSQSDEMMPHEKRRSILRKTGSMFTLNGGKLLTLRRNSSTDTTDTTTKTTNTIPEDITEDDDGSTPMSPNSANSRSGKLGIWQRLKRG